MSKSERKIVLIIHNVRSAHNAGSLFRTADGLGVEQVILSGYTPYPGVKDDDRLPHIAQKIERRIHKTALGAEATVKWKHVDDIATELKSLETHGYAVAALEQSPTAIPLNDYQPPAKIALLVGNEVTGVEPELLNLIDTHLQIPMLGQKESFNVAAAGAMALYHLRFIS